MLKPRTTALVVALALTLAACSGSSDDATPSTLASPAATTSASTTEPPPVTDVVNDTVASSTTEATTSTTEPPVPTTTQPSVEDRVRAAAMRTYDGYWDCLRAPDACNPGQSNLPGSDAFDAQTRTNAELADMGLFVGDEDLGYMVIESIEIKDDHTAVSSCWNLTAVLYLQPPIEGQPPIVQNDTPGYSRQVDEFVQDPEDDVWKIRRSDLIEQKANVNNCPPEES
jgi:hypothetical protein